MTKTEHPPEWPDKVMFAAMLVVIGGVLGAGFALLRMAGITMGDDPSDFFLSVRPWLALVLSAAMVAFGIVAIRYQATVWVWLGVGAGIVSVGAFGLVPLLCLVAVGFVLASHAEGEDNVHDGNIMHPSLWPDKALAASLLLLVAGIVSIFQAGLLMGDSLSPPILADQPQVLALVDAVAGLWCLFAAHEVFHLRRAWTGYVACGLAFVGLGFVVAGPVLAIAALVLLRKASNEDEFVGDNVSA